MSNFFKLRQLGSVCEILDSKRKPITKRNRVPGPYPYYGATGVLDYVADYIFDEPLVLIGEDGAKWGAGENTAYAVDGKCWVNNHAHVIRPNRDVVLDSWIIYYLNAADLAPFISGLTVPKLNQGRLREIPIPLPPIEEQKRLVAILDEAFAGIETAIANTGKNLANARELFESYADLAVRGLQGAHCCVKDCVEQVSTGPFGSLLHKSDYVSAGVPLVNPINIVDSRIVPDDRKCVAEDTLERLSAYVLKEGDVVVARRGEIGRCAVVDQEQDGWLCGTGCFFVRPTKELNPHFLVNLLRSETGRSELLRRSTGATMKNLGNKALSTFEIRLPPREAQDKAIEQLSDVQNASHDLTQVFRRKLGSLQQLKQSLLQKAFSGELTAAHAEWKLAGTMA